MAGWITAGALLLVALGLISERFFEQAAPAAESVLFTVDPPAGFSLAGPAASTSVPQLAVSPNGRYLTYVVAGPDGRSSLMLRPLDDPQSRPLAGTDGAADPFWSPDSRRIAFVSQGTLKWVDVGTAAPPQTVGRAPIDSRGGAWNADGTILFYSARPAVLSRVSEAGGPTADLPLGLGLGMARWPEFLPDQKHVLFQVRDAEPARRGVYVGSFDAGAPDSRRLIGSDWTAHYSSGYLLFLDSSSLMAQPFDASRLELSGAPAAVVRGVGGSSTAYGAFSLSSTGVLAYAGGLSNQSELRWVDRFGKPGTVIAPKGDYVDVSLSPDQSRVAYSRVDTVTQAPDVWIHDLARGTDTRITSERLVDASPIWSPNGEQIVFRSNRSSTIGVEMYLTTSSPGGTTRRMLGLEDMGGRTPSNLIPCCWLPDGQVVFYQATLDSGYGIWTTSVDQKTPKMIVDTQYNELQPAISPDRRWMAYASDQSGPYEIYVQDFPAGSRRTIVSTAGGMQPQWRGDGRELYYIQADGSFMQVEVKPGDRFDNVAPKALFKTEISTMVNPYRMDYVASPDGQKFLMKVPVKEASPAITVVLNWPALLKK